MDKLVLIVIMMIISMIGVGAAYIDGLDTGKRIMKEAASERGYGEWCAPDGRFAWKGECDA